VDCHPYPEGDGSWESWTSEWSEIQKNITLTLIYRNVRAMDKEPSESEFNSENKSTCTSLELVDYVIICPLLFDFLNSKEILVIKELSRRSQRLLNDNNLIFWNAMCKSYSLEYGLYFPRAANLSQNYFFDNLLPSSRKWSLNVANGTVHNFSISTIARFRPGISDPTGVELPLHQYLKVMRKNAKESIGDATQLIGQPDPEEFLDPFLNTLMRDPVRLRTSGSIVDRAIANHFVLRDRKDPFNHMRLTSDMLEPLPDLANRIREWRIKKAKGPDISLSVNDVSRAVEVDSVNPDLLEALAEMERLTLAADRVESEAFPHSSSSNNTDILHSSFVFPVLGGDSEVLPLPPGFSTDPNKLRLTKDRNVGENENDDENRTESAHNARKVVDEEDGEGECAGPRWRKPNATAESSKVVEVSNRKAQVTMCSPGVGIRHFNYSKVFEASGSQDEVYGHGARDLVTSVVNGFNACFLCYGQTGGPSCLQLH